MSIDKTATIPRKRMPAAVPRSEAESQPEPGWRSAWRQGTLATALLGSLLLWAALPPLNWWPLAWVAPIPWLMLIRKKALPGRRPYGALWLAGFVFWLGAVHWLRLPHPATSVGWIALSVYLAFYLPVFVGLTRAAVHRLRLPLVLAAPLVWTGLELAKGHLLTGFSMGLLGHTQMRWIDLIQVADFGGAYAVSFTLMFVAACLARVLPCSEQRPTYWPLLPAAALLAVVLIYGHFVQSGVRTTLGPKVALIQGSIDTTMKADPAEISQIHEQYIGLTRNALLADPDLDLIVWPETMCRASLVEVAGAQRRPLGGSTTLSDQADRSRAVLQRFAGDVGKRMLLGVDTLEYGDNDVTRYNSAVWIDPQLGVVDRYDKMHPVMFGEYVPFADRFPFLYRLTPLGSGIGAGERLPAFDLSKGFHGISTRLAANICFESAVPHLIRRQVAHLRAKGQEPHLLVNLTNDGWFWGSSELDMHLACGVFRAVEMRKPFLIAANTGFSAWIDSSGRIIEQGPRRATGFIIAHVELDDRKSFYSLYGDLFSGFCLAVCGFFAVAGLWPRV